MRRHRLFFLQIFRTAAVDERGSLPMLMLVVLVGMALAAVLVPLVITQTHTTTFDSGRGRALQAAESGIDLALGDIRAASQAGGSDGSGDGSGSGSDEGDATKLPCDDLAGTLGEVGSYSVQIAYYTKNPVGQDDTWLAANKMTCVQGYGVSDPSAGIYIPSYVLLTSTGTDGRTADRRILQTTYVVQTTDDIDPGGQIRLYPSGDINYCLTADGSDITLQPCQDPVPDSQKFAYADQLGIVLVSSDGTQCLKTDGSSGKPLEMGPCGSQNQAPWIEMWGFDNDSHFRVSDPNEKSLSDDCFGTASTPTPTPPYAAVVLEPCSGSWQDQSQAWIPSPYVGSGGAGATNGQLVNFYQFGRCLDIPDYDVTSTFLIAYGCMQLPSKGATAAAPWNQVFTPSPAIPTDSGKVRVPPTQSQWQVTCPSGGDGSCTAKSTFCLTNPGTAGAYVTVTTCAASNSAQQWIRYQTVDQNGNPLKYQDKYTIQPVGGTGLCLSLGGDDDMYHGFYFKVTVQTCDGSTQQKWNAQKTDQDPGMEDLHEK